ncbi:sensor histidine kinase [Enterococcus sp. AZ163]|uniref:sensor histidine kinase n=1 Tax=Enterococcus sp. AZ163 TaxID=2774638 RepID=UPI003D26FDAC
MNGLHYETLVSITSSIIENVIISQYFVAVMRKNSIVRHLNYLVWVINFLLLFTSTQFIFSPFVRIVITAVVLLLYSFQYEEKVAVKMLLIFAYISLAAIAEELAASTIALLPSSPISYNYVDRFLSILLASIFLILLIELLSTFVFKMQKIFYFESKIYYILTPLFSITLTVMFFFDLHTSEYKIMALILLAGMNFCFFMMIKANVVTVETKNQLANRELELMYQRNIAKKNVEQFKDVRKKTHDTNKHLILIKALLEDGQNDKAIQHLAEYLEMVNSSISKIVTGHVGIDSMLDYCHDLADRHNIKLFIDANIENKEFKIDDIDITVLMGNIIDNAVEANLRLLANERRKVELKVVTNHKHLYVQSNNPIQGEVNVNRTSKSNKNNHGYGIAAIKQIVEKYDGVINIDTTDKEFSLMVILPYK